MNNALKSADAAATGGPSVDGDHVVVGSPAGRTGAVQAAVGLTDLRFDLAQRAVTS